jgi:hypothetical protein
MKLETRLEKLEAHAAPQGHCPHLPPIVRYFDSDGTEQHRQGQNEAERAMTCDCGRDRLTIQVNYTVPENMPKAADLTDDELAAIIARS